MARPDDSIYPIHANTEFVHPDEIERYIEFVFGGVEWNQDRFLGMRGIGEKGTSRDGKTFGNEFLQPSHGGALTQIFDLARRWAMHHVATFCMPCVLSRCEGTADAVELLTVILGDMDSGDTDAKMAYMVQHLGEPSMVVLSGGVTETGHAKRHVYYRLSEPSMDIPRVMKLRDQLWRKCGGDSMMGLGVDSNPYGRAHQPVRIAGTCHAKRGEAKSCLIEFESGPDYDLAEIESLIDAMPQNPEWEPVANEQPELASREEKPRKLAGSMFSQSSGKDGDSERSYLTKPVSAGGDGAATRYANFNQAAGHFIHCIRAGEMTPLEALEGVKGWAEAMQRPPWDETRIEQEFSAILDTDVNKHGPMPKPRAPLVPEDAPEGLQMWAAHRWITEPKPRHEFLVNKMVIKGEPHLLVAEGGSGKTFLVADLAMKVAAFEEGDEYEWCGEPVLTGGTTVLILCEDSKTEMHIRLLDLNKDGLIEKAGDRLIILPMTSAELCGSFSLCARGQGGEMESSPRWNEMVGLMGRLPNLSLVALDTLNSVSHGDENSAIVIAELMREAGRVTGELGAALVVNHHVRKGDSQNPIRSIEMLNESIRGSTAIPSYFRINMGMYKPGDYERRLNAMGEPVKKGSLWRFGITKANINGLIEGEKTLLRNEVGLLVDVTKRDKFADVNLLERLAWLVFAIESAVSAGHPYKRGKGSDAIYTRRNELPGLLRHVGPREFERLIEDAMQSSLLVATTAPGGKSKTYLDVPGGLLSRDDYAAKIQPGAYESAPEWANFEFNEVEGNIQDRGHLYRPRITAASKARVLVPDHPF